MRPSYLANYLRISAPRIREMVARLDASVSRLHARRESEEVSKAVSC
jgi:division protein CdvB (Snf7/Vps24/ESCRT-III family)